MAADYSTMNSWKAAVDILPTIPEFFKGCSVLVTGGTGFIGKALVEKILYSCPEVEKIYLLVRPKKGLSTHDRIQQLIQQPVFNRLRGSRIGWEDKLVPVEGDVGATSDCGLLGLSQRNSLLLIERVSVIFHCAATVRFDDPLSHAVVLNVRGTLHLLQLAEKMKSLKVMVHVSTTYCHTERQDLDEAVYPPPADWRDIIWASENLQPFELAAITHKILGRLPNTYGFSKALAEQVVYEHRNALPLLIFRPSIVSSAIEEPLPGWLDNFNGPVGLLVASGKGVVRTVFVKNTLVCDFCPVDIAVKGIIVAAWLRAASTVAYPDPGDRKVPSGLIPKEGFKDPALPVYNCTTAAVKSVSIEGIVNMAWRLSEETPFNDILWYPGGSVTTSRILHLLYVAFLHLLPAFLIDTSLWLQGKKTRLWRLQRRIYSANKALEYYLTHQWQFHSKAYSQLSHMYLLEPDHKHFAHDVSGVDEVEYFRKAVIGCRRYLLNEPDSTLPAARVNIKRMYWMDRCLRVAFGLLLLYLLWP